jgi:propanol-preferring alcohol dehydrogenase
VHRRLGDTLRAAAELRLLSELRFRGVRVGACAVRHPVPDAVSSRDAAPLTCAGVTTHKAIKVARVAPAERVAVFGVGGLGHLGFQYARIAGGLVTSVDVEDDKLDLARSSEPTRSSTLVPPIRSTPSKGWAAPTSCW